MAATAGYYLTLSGNRLTLTKILNLLPYAVCLQKTCLYRLHQLNSLRSELKRLSLSSVGIDFWNQFNFTKHINFRKSWTNVNKLRIPRKHSNLTHLNNVHKKHCLQLHKKLESITTEQRRTQQNTTIKWTLIQVWNHSFSFRHLFEVYTLVDISVFCSLLVA